MPDFRKLYTPQDSAVVFIDDQPQMLFPPVRAHRGYYRPAATPQHAARCAVHHASHAQVARVPIVPEDGGRFFGTLGCGCFAF